MTTLLDHPHGLDASTDAPPPNGPATTSTLGLRRPTAADAVPFAPRRQPGVALWRALIAVAGFWGMFAGLAGDIANLRYFSVITSLLVGVVAAAGALVAIVGARRFQPAVDWCRGATTAFGIVTALIFLTALSADYSQIDSLLMHAIVPGLVVADWLAFRPARQQRWSTPLGWLAVPISYLALYYNVRADDGGPLYPFIDPTAPSFWLWVGVMVVAFAIIGFAVWAVGRLPRWFSRESS